MKHLHERRLAVTTAIKQAMLAAPLLLSGAASFAATQADPIPMLALFHTDDNGTEPACGVELPATGSGRTVNVLPKKQCPENARAPYSIRIRNVPIKSTFLLTDNERCEKANSAWVELDTSRANARSKKSASTKSGSTRATRGSRVTCSTPAWIPIHQSQAVVSGSSVKASRSSRANFPASRSPLPQGAIDHG